MEHDPWFELVSAAADGQLDEAEQARLDEHLPECAPCREHLEQFEADRRRRRVATPTDRGELLASIHQARADQLTDLPILARPGRRLVVRAGVVSVGVAAAVAAFVAMTSSAEPTPSPRLAAHGDVVVDAHAQSFDQAEIEVPAGSVVEWRNTGATRHLLVRKLGPVTITEDLLPGSSEEAEFTQPGVYDFSCAIHPEMEGTVTVEA